MVVARFCTHLSRVPRKAIGPATRLITPLAVPGPLFRRAPQDLVRQPGRRPAERHQGSHRGVPMQRHRMAGRPDLLHRDLCGQRRRLRCARVGGAGADARALTGWRGVPHILAQSRVHLRFLFASDHPSTRVACTLLRRRPVPRVQQDLPVHGLPGEPHLRPGQRLVQRSSAAGQWHPVRKRLVLGRRLHG
jgi:hypothetical protein